MFATLIERYRSSGISEVIDHEKFNHISVVHHSTRIEGSTLTEVESQVLITEDLTPKGKPLDHSLMVKDHYKALTKAMAYAKEKRLVNVQLIQEFNGDILKNTGQIINSILGTVDTSTGAFRKGNVSAGVSFFPNYDKVEKLTEDLVKTIQGRMKLDLTLEEQVNLSFDAHFNLVSIHPFYDGNGRTSRLLMNYIQAYYQLPLAIVHESSKAAYIQALVEAREKEDIGIFRAFMAGDYRQLLQNELKNYDETVKGKGGKGFTLLF